MEFLLYRLQRNGLVNTEFVDFSPFIKAQNDNALVILMKFVILSLWRSIHTENGGQNAEHKICHNKKHKSTDSSALLCKKLNQALLNRIFLDSLG